MSDTYYSYQDVKRKIAHRLFNMMGWTVYGYHADESDIMTDYYSPAYWGGIAEKNGYILVIDRYDSRTEPEYSTIRTKASVQADAETAAKIAKLERMTTARGASAAEEATAKAKIEALRNKASKAEGMTEEKKLVSPAHKANPPRCNWHIEKDGIIIDKGTGLLKFAGVPDISGSGYASEVEDWQKFNTLTPEEWKDQYIEYECRRWGEHERERATRAAETRYNEAKSDYALLDKFNELLARWNNLCGGMVSNGSGEDGYIFEEITVTEYKKELKPQETSGSIKDGQCFILKSNFNYGCTKGTVYRIKKSFVDTNGKQRYTSVRLGKGYKKELSGMANSANSFSVYNEDKFLSWIEKGYIAFCDLVEVSTPYEVKKVVKKAVRTEARTEETTTAAEKKTAENTQSATATDTKAAEKEETAQTAENTPNAEQTAPEKAQEAKKEESAQDQQEEKAAEMESNDLFADLARAFITGKQAPKKPHKAAETAKPEESTPPEAPQAAQEEEKPYLIGYHGQASDILTGEDINALTGFQTVHKGEKWTERTYIATPYKVPEVCLVYAISGKDIEPDKTANYAGFIANGAFYSDLDAIRAKCAVDINRAILDAINSLDAAKALFDTLPKDNYSRRGIEDYLTYSREMAARELFYKDEKPLLRLYGSGKAITAADIINYLTAPEKTVKSLANAFIDANKADIYKMWIDYAKTGEELQKILSDADNPAHALKRIQKSISGGEKTVKILLSNGKEIKADADAIKRIGYTGYISSWSIQASDRQHLTGREVKPDDIRQITHGGRILYKAS